MKTYLQELCEIPDHRSQAVNILRISKLKSRAYPVLLNVLDQRCTRERSSIESYRLSAIYWARQLITIINHIRCSDIYLSLDPGTINSYLPDAVIKIILSFSLCGKEYIPEPSDLASVELDHLAQRITRKTSERKLSTYKTLKFITRELENYKLITNHEHTERLHPIFHIQKLLSAARSARDGGDTNYCGYHPLMAAIVAYVCRKCGIDASITWNALRLNIAFVRVTVTSDEIKKDPDSLPEEYHQDDGTGLMYYDPFHCWLRTCDYVREMLGDEHIGPISLKDTSLEIFRSSFSSSPLKLIVPEICFMSSFIPLYILHPSAQEGRSSIAPTLSQSIVSSYPQAFPILDNIISARPQCMSALLSGLTMAQSKFVLPDFAMDSKGRLTLESMTQAKKIFPRAILDPDKVNLDHPVSFRVGQVVHFENSNAEGVIVGWDAKHRKYPKPNGQPFYDIMVVDPKGSKLFSKVYAPQDTMELVKTSSEIDKDTLDIILGCQGSCDHGSYFLRFDAEKCELVPNRALQELYQNEDV